LINLFDKEHEKNNFIVLSEQYFVLNHYNCQSEEFWRNVKCTRGDVNEYKTRTIDDFAALDQNDVVDTRLRDRRPRAHPDYPLRHQN
jgi:5-bromo-4-chloroindolyl phosphate hydrolysis protein